MCYRINKGGRKNYANYTQTLHLILHLADFPRVTKCIVYAPNYTQTIHKLYIELYIEMFKPLHCDDAQTLHKTTRKPYIATARSFT